MVTRSELALEIIGWVALFLPALAMMLNTLLTIYEDSLLEKIGFAESRKTEILQVSIVSFAAAMFALFFSLVYLLGALDLFSIIPSHPILLLLSSGCILVAVGWTAFVLSDIYRAGNLSSINTAELSEIADSDPEKAAVLLEMAGSMKQISQSEMDLIDEKLQISERISDQEDQEN